jgi:hypothetical protein
MPSDDESGWRVRIEEKMFPKIEVWFQRTVQTPLVPEPGSSLARDDQDFSWFPPSNVAYGQIVTAVEHLELFRTSFLASRQLYPSAHFTVLRSALVGAAQALWVLKPRQRVIRIEHAARLVREDLKQTKGLLSVGLPSELELGEDVATARDRLDEQLRELLAAAAAVGLDPVAVRDWRLNTTDMIKRVSELVHADNPSVDTQYGASLLWRLQSGHAHGMPSARIRQIRSSGQVSYNLDGTVTGAATRSAGLITTRRSP